MADNTNHPGLYENRTKVSDLTIAEFRALVADCFDRERKRAAEAEIAKAQEVGVGLQTKKCCNNDWRMWYDER